MRLISILFIVVLIAIIGGIGYIASTDVTVEQDTVSQSLPNERFYNES